jgi:hypothetical protein
MNMGLPTRAVLYWMIVIPLYCYASFYLFWHYAGPTGDNGGIMPGLILPGLHPPSVSYREYMGSWRLRLEYRLPYFVVASIFTVMGCCVPNWILARSPRLSSHPFAASHSN